MATGHRAIRHKPSLDPCLGQRHTGAERHPDLLRHRQSPVSTDPDRPSLYCRPIPHVDLRRLRSRLHHPELEQSRRLVPSLSTNSQSCPSNSPTPPAATTASASIAPCWDREPDCQPAKRSQCERAQRTMYAATNPVACLTKAEKQSIGVD